MVKEKNSVARTAEFVTTRMAAELLGVSVGTVINMVDRGQLVAWRTSGGHRRVTRASVQASLERGKENQTASQPPRLRILAIEDDAFVRDLYRDEFAAWQLPIELRAVENGVGGLIEIGRFAPDVLLLDLGLPEVDGFEVLGYLRSASEYRDLDIIVISGLTPDEITARGGLPAGVVFWPKPAPLSQLRGFIDARLAARSRAAARSQSK